MKTACFIIQTKHAFGALEGYRISLFVMVAGNYAAGTLLTYSDPGFNSI